MPRIVSVAIVNSQPPQVFIAEVDVYASEDLFTARDVAFAATELQFTPLFRD